MSDALTIPSFGTRWLHHSGRVYCVIGISNVAGIDDDARREKYPATVHYIGLNGIEWSGRLDDWNRRMTLVTKSASEEVQAKSIAVFEVARKRMAEKQMKIEHQAFMEAE